MEGKAVICSVGDLMLSDSPLYVSVGVGTAYPKMKGQIFRDCLQEFNSADIVIGNLESVVHEPKHNNVTELQMSSSKSMVEELQEAGFNALNLANNHCLQHGTACFLNTKAACEEMGMLCTGLKDEKPCQKKVNGINFAFLSVCLYTEFYQPDDIQYEDDIARILQKVTELKNECSDTVVVLSVHWGDEFATYPSNTQIELAHLLVDSGVDILLGHHSHVFQGIEKYKKSIILYSQGNFVSDMIPEICKETGMVKILVCVENGKKEIDYEFVPYHINERFIPVRSEDKWIEERQWELEQALSGNVSDETYMKMVNSNHRSCHNLFKDYFTSNFFKYRINISFGMLYAFFVRKIKKARGTYPKRYDLDAALLLAKDKK